MHSCRIIYTVRIPILGRIYPSSLWDSESLLPEECDAQHDHWEGLAQAIFLCHTE